jgi:hypothetical protein
MLVGVVASHNVVGSFFFLLRAINGIVAVLRYFSAQTPLAEYVRETAPGVQRWLRAELAKMGRGGSEPSTRLISPRAPPDSPASGPLTFSRAVGVTRKPRTEFRYAFANLHHFAEWGLMVVRAVNAKDLCQCRLPSCEDFFLAVPTDGRTRRGFCTKEHMTEENSRTSRERMAAKRAGISVAAWRRRHK